MKLTKREKIMLLILGGLLFAYSYFYFILGPQFKTIQTINKSQGLQEEEMERKQYTASLEPQVMGEAIRLEKDIRKLSNRFFPAIEQGPLIILLDTMIDDTGIFIPAISFSEIKKEEIGQNVTELITATLPYEGNYESLIAFLQKIRQHEKSIVIKNLTVSAEDSNTIEGNIILDFYSVPQPLLVETPVLKESSGGEGRFNPFDPFKGYIGKIIGDLEKDGGVGEYSSPRSWEAASQPTIPVEKTETYEKVMLYNFEALNVFAVGTPREVIGGLQLQTSAMEGQYALGLAYDFLRPREKSVANIVFEGKKILLPQQPEQLGLWVYSLERNQHSIGMVIRDARGIEHDIFLANTIDWMAWKQLTTALPQSISYPAEVTRIYVSSKDFDNIIRGELYFDQLEAMYLPQMAPKIEEKLTKPNVVNTDPIRYRVQKGDTIFSISKKFYNDYTKRHLILQHNNIKDPNDIKIDQILLIPRL